MNVDRRYNKTRKAVEVKSMRRSNAGRKLLGLLSVLIALANEVDFGLAFVVSSHDGSPRCRRICCEQPGRSEEVVFPNDPNMHSRKRFFNHAARIVVSSIMLSPDIATAAAPISTKETDSLGVMAKRALRPKPPKVLRRKLSMDFAVLLMRSSYNSLDKLDCVAMDQFQRDFFIIRRSEYEPYIKALGPGVVQQGDLTDPYYFDFISFAQYKTINREISQDPPYIFEEQQPMDEGDDVPQTFVPVLIKRDPTLRNDMLGPEHSRMVGSIILDRLEEVFGSSDSAIPKLEKDSKPDPAALLAAIQQLVNLFLVNGYAFSGKVSIERQPGTTTRGTIFLITLNAPATLWGGRILQMEGAPLSNDFLVKAVKEYINRVGYNILTAIKYDGSTEEITITIK